MKREIGLLSAMVIVVANMVGSGIFTTSGFIVGQLGSAWMLLTCWLVGGLFALAGALCYGEMGAMLPKAGGEYAYLHYAFGPVPAFLSGWVSLVVGFSAPIGAAAIAFATYFLGGGTEPWLAVEFAGRRWLTVSGVTLLACAVVVLFSIVHSHSLRLGTRVQNLLTMFKLAVIVLFSVAGMMWGKGDWSHLGAVPDNGAGGWGPFAVALIFVSFSYSGWNAAAYLGGEIRQPGRNLPLALMAGTGLVIALYLALNLVYVYALPASAMQGTLEVGTAAATALFGPAMGRAFGLVIALGLLSVLSAMIMAGPRVYYAMARDGLFFRRFAGVHQTRRTPVGAIWLQAAIAIGMILCAAYDALLIYIGFTLSLTAVATVAGLFWLRHTAPEMARPYRAFGYPLTPALFIVGNLWIVCHTVASRPLVVGCGLATIAIGWAVQSWFNKQSGQTQRHAAADTGLGPA
ncbi:amino acid permease [Desulfosarcina ovata subsp. ovata]|uniref:Amino acid permease n=1 Tax=Desulfosarcina ovata subsp. ovata TaxID=2752305 RepID=A0A5K8AF43_9BACT|nr:amino acid permease [Desulfosarcina ovata subsp. ovata]